MPKIWSETIAAHRDAVRETTLDTTAALIARHGLTGVTMAQIARESGIGRATLYKYFPDLDAILLAWHERQIGAHLHHLSEVGAAAKPSQRLEAVLRAYASLSRHGDHGGTGDHSDHGDHGGTGGHAVAAASALHASEHAAQAHVRLDEFVTGLIREAADRGEVRTDVPAPELAAFCLHALTAAAGLTSKAALDRLVTVTLSALRAKD